ncbi:MAG TPA: hypothetical protein VF988_11210 [Verrucomicrobiae bacterium]
MKIPAALLLGVSLLLTASCAHLQPALSPNAKPEAQSAILYGRFSVGTNFVFHNKLALWLADQKNHPVYVCFDAAQPVYGIQVHPGRYQIVGFAGLDRADKIEGRLPFSGSPQPFAATADKPIYLGDFTGEMTWDGLARYEWKIKSFTDNYAATTAEFHQKFPGCAAMPTESVFRLSALKN